jgi:hypothetical protein
MCIVERRRKKKRNMHVALKLGAALPSFGGRGVGVPSIIFSSLPRDPFFFLSFLRLVIYFLLVSFSARDSGITSMTYPKERKITHTTQEGDVFH